MITDRHYRTITQFNNRIIPNLLIHYHNNNDKEYKHTFSRELFEIWVSDSLQLKVYSKLSGSLICKIGVLGILDIKPYEITD